MSAASRKRDQEHERERALLGMRAAVISDVAWHRGEIGLAGVEEAVDEALAQLVAASQHLVGDAADVQRLWVGWARRRLIDEQRSANARHRDPIHVGEHAQALTVSVSGDITQPTDDGRALWRIRELFSVLHGDQRRWAEAWYDEVLTSGTQPRGLPQTLGWTANKTKLVSRRARRKMAAFLEDRASGAICADRRSLIDAFIHTSTRDTADSAVARLDDEQYAAVLFHVAGCEDCWAIWHARRRSLLGRCHSILLLPVDALATAVHALGERLATAAVGAHSATQALLARLGLGGAGAAALGGSAATISGKTAAVCVGVVCAATAGGEIAGVLPILHERTPKTRDAASAKPEKASAQPAAHVLRNTVSATPSPVRSAATLAAASRTEPKPHTATIQAPATPGDLPIARAARSSSTPTRGTGTPSTGLSTLSAPSASSTTTRPPRATTSATTGEPDCVPGDLGC